MPIDCDIRGCRLSRETFHALDYRVLGHAFAVHRELGCLQDEPVYQEALHRYCRRDALASRREVPIVCRHGSFEKTYYIDLIVDEAVIYELKAVAAFETAHRSQLTHYLALTGVNCGKLVNFRPASVETEYVTTQIGHDDRRRYEVDWAEWKESTERTHAFRQCLTELLADWGASLSTSLYSDALIHLLGGPEQVLTKSPVICDGEVVGKTRMCALDDQNAFCLTGFADPKAIASRERHIRRQLAHSSFQFMHWVNLNGPDIRIKTVGGQQ